MNDVAELARFAVTHARNQNVPEETLRAVLDRIEHDREGEAGSWAVEWTRQGGRAAPADPLAAAAFYGLARFPYVNGPARAAAQRRLTETFGGWAEGTSLSPLEVTCGGAALRAWTVGLSEAEPRPLVLLLGGIVAPKEQYAPALLMIERLGLAGVALEMPGVGENRLRYDEEAWRMFPALIDAVAGRAEAARTYAVAMSFSGHLALRAALNDDRIRGIVLAGAPVRRFFTEVGRAGAVPRVTVDTLAHLLGCAPPELGGRIGSWGLGDDELAALKIPVRAVVSARDEIIPAEDVELLRRHVADLDTLVHDDVHGSPRHVEESRLWSVLSVVRMLGDRDGIREQLESALTAAAS